MRVGIYCRVSGLSQRENSSLQNQRILGEDFCNRSGYEYQIFEDVESGGKLNRKQFTNLLKLCKEGVINGIWVYDNDRLGRDYDVSGDIRKLIQKYNLKLFVGWEEVKLDESKDRFNYNIRSVMSDYERMRINERFAYGKKRSFQNGKGLGIVGFGYQKNREGYVEINPTEEKIIKDIVKIYLRKDIKYFSEVESRIVNRYGKVVNGKRLNGGLVNRVLCENTTKYLGKIYREYFERNIYEFNICIILSDVDYNKIQKKKGNTKGFRKSNVKINYLLKGKVVCGDCGGNLWVKRGGKKLKSGKVFSYYYCNNEERKKKYKMKFDKYVIKENRFRKNRKVDLKEYESMYGKFTDCKCIDNNTISVEKLEGLVWNSLYDFVIKSDKIKKEYKLRYENNLGNKDRFSSKLKYYQKQMEDEEEKKMKMLDKWLDGEIDSESKESWIVRNKIKLNELKTNISKLKTELKKFNVVDKIDDYIDLMKNDLKNEFKVDRFEDKRRVIEKYVDEVSVKLLYSDNLKKEYEVGVKLHYTIDDDGNKTYKVGVEMNKQNITHLGYKYESDLAERQFHTYKLSTSTVYLNLLYKLRVTNVGLDVSNPKKNQRELIKID